MHPSIISGMSMRSGVAKSFDWRLVSSGTVNALTGVSIYGNVALAVGAGGTILRSTDGGSSWASVSSGTTNYLSGIALFGSVAIAVGDLGTILRSTDGGSSWASVSSGTTNYLRTIAMSGSVAVAVGYSGTILRSTDSGSSWSSVGIVTPYAFMGVAMSSNIVVAAGSGYAIYRSTDSGATWNLIRSHSSNGAHICVGAYGSTFVCAGLRGGGSNAAIEESLDGGITWTSKNFSLYENYCISIFRGIQVLGTGYGNLYVLGGVGRSTFTAPSFIYGVAITSTNAVAVGSNGFISVSP